MPPPESVPGPLDPPRALVKRAGATDPVERYYRLHAALYDATRWAVLHGRDEIVDWLAEGDPPRVLEVGCGTGRNLRRLAERLPEADVLGVDLSGSMLRRACRAVAAATRVQLRHERYGPETVAPRWPGAVLFAYSLSMMNPGAEAAIRQAVDHLPPGGRIAVVDFHRATRPGFARWMGWHHVRMDGHLLPALRQAFLPIREEIRSALCWQYVLFLGRRR